MRNIIIIFVVKVFRDYQSAIFWMLKFSLLLNNFMTPFICPIYVAKYFNIPDIFQFCHSTKICQMDLTPTNLTLDFHIAVFYCLFFSLNFFLLYIFSFIYLILFLFLNLCDVSFMWRHESSRKKEVKMVWYVFISLIDCFISLLSVIIIWYDTI